MLFIGNPNSNQRVSLSQNIFVSLTHTEIHESVGEAYWEEDFHGRPRKRRESNRGWDRKLPGFTIPMYETVREEKQKN